MSVKRKRVLILIILLGAYISYSIYEYSHPEILYSKEIKIGNEIIKKIETYKRLHNKLPCKLYDIGVKETLEGPIFYQKITEHRYLVHFGMSLGESCIYYSSTGKWDFEK